MTESNNKLKEILIKHKKDNFWSGFKYLTEFGGYTELNAFDELKDIYDNLSENVVEFIFSYNQITVYLLKEIECKNIREMVEYGIKNKLPLYELPSDYIEEVSLTIQIPMLHYYLKELYLKSGGKIIDNTTTQSLTCNDRFVSNISIGTDNCGYIGDYTGVIR